jgi:hypothetical protein
MADGFVSQRALADELNRRGIPTGLGTRPAKDKSTLGPFLCPWNRFRPWLIVRDSRPAKTAPVSQVLDLADRPGDVPPGIWDTLSSLGGRHTWHEVP